MVPSQFAPLQIQLNHMAYTDVSRAHNPKVAGSNPAPATKLLKKPPVRKPGGFLLGAFQGALAGALQCSAHVSGPDTPFARLADPAGPRLKQKESSRVHLQRLRR